MNIIIIYIYIYEKYLVLSWCVCKYKDCNAASYYYCAFQLVSDFMWYVHVLWNINKVTEINEHDETTSISG